MLREKFIRAMRREDESFIPMEFDLCPSKLEEFKTRTGKDDYFEYYGFPFRFVYAQNIPRDEVFKSYYHSPDELTFDDWGVGYKAGSVAHFTEMQHPMKDFVSIEEFENFPYPDPDKNYIWSDLAKQIHDINEKGLATIAAMPMTIFEISWYLRGMDNFMVDMVINPELAVYLLDRITEIRCEFAKRYALLNCDFLFLGDDVSTQLDMMISPSTWREFIKPRLQKVIKAAKEVKPDILIAYHGDGNLYKIIPDLIEVGVEILNPVQPECIDPVEIKKEFGDMLSFWGTVGTQTTMPFGTSEEVKRVCRRMIEEVGKGGGLILAPTHTIEPEVPWENIEAFVDSVNDYNKGASQ